MTSIIRGCIVIFLLEVYSYSVEPSQLPRAKKSKLLQSYKTWLCASFLTSIRTWPHTLQFQTLSKAGSVAQVVPTTDGLTSYTQGQQLATS